MCFLIFMRLGFLYFESRQSKCKNKKAKEEAYQKKTDYID